VLAEQGVFALGDDRFAVTVLRQGTLYGLSPRIRFDLVINVMTLALERDGIIMVRGGEQWRPLLHVADSAAAFLLALGASREVIASEVFNVGGHNFTISDVAQQVQAASGEGKIVNDATSRDTRSYRVRTEKIRHTLGFVPAHTPGDGARELLEALRQGKLNTGTKTSTIDWYKQLLMADPTVLDQPFTSATPK
jgi:nucleoside-diphosphate-sugar epimerase